MYRYRFTTEFSIWRRAGSGRRLTPSSESWRRVQGTDAAGSPWEQEVCGAETSGDLLTSLWGRARVRDLEDRYASRLGAEDKKLAEQIVAVSLESHVLSRFTAYIAIDRSEVVNADGKPREILQPVELPSGWEQPEPLFCRAAPASGSVLYSSAAAPTAGAHIGGSKARLRQSGGAPLDRLKAAADSFKSPGWFSPRRTRLKALIDALVDLESQLQALRHPRLPEVSELIERGRELLAGYNRGAKQPPSASGVEEYVAKIQTLIEELRQSPGLMRAGFWK
ncbi:MAG: hypothetical protein B7Z73_13350 [Planctomycetia bacterium 21-64-5]|nr:MAG: hypothetical protein B7Z73_13350 [Planctomycetia bacterium 21-64-5]